MSLTGINVLFHFYFRKKLLCLIQIIFEMTSSGERSDSMYCNGREQNSASGVLVIYDQNFYFCKLCLVVFGTLFTTFVIEFRFNRHLIIMLWSPHSQHIC